MLGEGDLCRDWGGEAATAVPGLTQTWCCPNDVLRSGFAQMMFSRVRKPWGLANNTPGAAGAHLSTGSTCNFSLLPFPVMFRGFKH